MPDYDLAGAMDAAATTMDTTEPSPELGDASEDYALELATDPTLPATEAEPAPSPAEETPQEELPAHVRARFNQLGNQLQTLQQQLTQAQQQTLEAQQYRQRYEALLEQSLRQHAPGSPQPTAPPDEFWNSLSGEQQTLMQQLVQAAFERSPHFQALQQSAQGFQTIQQQQQQAVESQVKLAIEQAAEQYGAAFTPYRGLIESTLALHGYRITPQVRDWIAGIKTTLDQQVAGQRQRKQAAGINPRSLAPGVTETSPMRQIGKKSIFDVGKALDMAVSQVRRT